MCSSPHAAYTIRASTKSYRIYYVQHSTYKIIAHCWFKSEDIQKTFFFNFNKFLEVKSEINLSFVKNISEPYLWLLLVSKKF